MTNTLVSRFQGLAGPLGWGSSSTGCWVPAKLQSMLCLWHLWRATGPQWDANPLHPNVPG